MIIQREDQIAAASASDSSSFLSKGMGLVNRSVKNDEEIVSEPCIFSKLEGCPRSAVLPPAVVHGLPLPNEHVHVVVRVHFLEAVVDLDECFLLGAASALVDLGLDLLEELIVLDVVGADAAIEGVDLVLLELAGLASEDRGLVLHDDEGLVAHQGLEVLLDLYYICLIH